MNKVEDGDGMAETTAQQTGNAQGETEMTSTKNGTDETWARHQAVKGFIKSIGSRSVRENFLIAGRLVADATEGDDSFDADRQLIEQFPNMDMQHLGNAASEVLYRLGVDMRKNGCYSMAIDEAEYALDAAMTFFHENEVPPRSEKVQKLVKLMEGKGFTDEEIRQATREAFKQGVVRSWVKSETHETERKFKGEEAA